MGRDHFKKVMFTPNFVKDSYEELGHNYIEHKIENIFKVFLKPFKALRQLRVSKED